MIQNDFQKVLLGTSGILGEDTRKRFSLAPVKILKTWGNVNDAQNLVGKAMSQALIDGTQSPCVLYNAKGTGEKAAVLVDYGKEIHGTVRVVVSTAKRPDGTNVPFKARIRFGESISEAITPVYSHGATNDHAVRDTLCEFAFMSHQETGETGFRYFYFELDSEDVAVKIESLTAVLIINDLQYFGSFCSSDKVLDNIWLTSAYTVHLNLQQYLWDGIKRDRIVWLGDMNTEIETNFAVFGDNEIIRKSLDFAVETTPLPRWMNGIPSYSFWWLINLECFYMHTGDKAFLARHRDYILALSRQILGLVSPSGELAHNTARGFVDWSTKDDEAARICGFYGLFALCLDTISRLSEVLCDTELPCLCKQALELIKKNLPKPVKQKIGAALLAVGGLYDAKYIDSEFIEPGGVSGYSTFMGYSILGAKALAGNFGGAIRAIKDYWGEMTRLGATTYWEDFDISWTQNCTRIDEFPVEGKDDVHADFGKHCYKGLRHSLCHGWASGPCPWLTKYVLGINVAAPGMKKVIINPHLCELEFAKGSIPTPMGTLFVSHTKGENGKIVTEFSAPEGIEVEVLGQ